MVAKGDPLIGTMAPATNLEDAEYLDFLEGIRLFEGAALRPALRPRYEEAIAEFQRTHGRNPTRDEVRAILDRIPIFQSRKRVWRSSQESMWQGVIDTYRKQQDQLLAELDRADRMGPGTVSYDPSFPYPAYFDSYDAHIQPGSYHRDPLAGYIYHYGTKLFYQGRNDTDDVQRGQVFRAPLPADGRVERILDVGCSVGQSTTAWKERFPDAEVWGIDIASPMIRYAHKRAIEMGIDVHFAQMASEHLEFQDNSFDVAHAFILFHEIPEPVIRQTLREVCRVLRSGGVFVVFDFGKGNYRDGSTFSDYMMSFIIDDNGEPFARDFCTMDFPAELRAAGFSRIEEHEGATLTVATK